MYHLTNYPAIFWIIGGVTYYLSTETLDGITTGGLGKAKCCVRIFEKVSQEGIKPEVTGMPGVHADH